MYIAGVKVLFSRSMILNLFFTLAPTPRTPKNYLSHPRLRTTVIEDERKAREQGRRGEGRGGEAANM